MIDLIIFLSHCIFFKGISEIFLMFLFYVYCLVLTQFQIPSSSQRTKLDAEVLNDHWKCVAPSIKDYSSKHMSKNLNEMTLFECEDDRLEHTNDFSSPLSTFFIDLFLSDAVYILQFD